MYGIIDRFEGNYTVVEMSDRTMINIEKSKMPVGAREGDVLDKINDLLIINVEETNKRRREIEELTKNVWE